MLLSGHAQVTGGVTVEQGFVVKQRHGAVSAVAVVGRPPHEAIVSALADITALTPVLAQMEDAAWVGSALASVSGAAAPWRGETFVVHALADPDRVVAIVDQPLVRMLRLDDALEHLPPGSAPRNDSRPAAWDRWRRCSRTDWRHRSAIPAGRPNACGTCRSTLSMSIAASRSLRRRCD